MANFNSTPMMKGIWNIADDIGKIPYIANIFKIIFSKTSGLVDTNIITKLCTKHLWVKGINYVLEEVLFVVSKLGESIIIILYSFAHISYFIRSIINSNIAY